MVYSVVVGGHLQSKTEDGAEVRKENRNAVTTGDNGDGANFG